jgi:hypothetical protein
LTPNLKTFLAKTAGKAAVQPQLSQVILTDSKNLNFNFHQVNSLNSLIIKTFRFSPAFEQEYLQTSGKT